MYNFQEMSRCILSSKLEIDIRGDLSRSQLFCDMYCIGGLIRFREVNQRRC